MPDKPMTPEEIAALQEELSALKAENEKAKKEKAKLAKLAKDSLGALDGDAPDLKASLEPLAKAMEVEVLTWPELVKKAAPEPQIPEALKAQWETMTKAREADQARIEKLEKAAKDREYLTKAEAEFSHVPGLSLPEMAVLLRKAHDADLGKDLEQLLKATEGAMAKSGLFKEIGSQLGDDGSDAFAKLEKLAQERMQKSTEPMTKAQALRMVSRENPELRRQTAQQ